MAETIKRTFSLTAEQAAFIDGLVERGDYASASEVVRAGLRALKEHDAVIDQWLREEVVPTYERVRAGIEPTYTVEEVRARLRTHIAARKKQRRRRAA
jgi:antitoxin ParD1/3/4